MFTSLMKTFSPAVDLQTRQLVWSCFDNGVQVKKNDEPQVYDSVFISNLFANQYSF